VRSRSDVQGDRNGFQQTAARNVVVAAFPSEIREARRRRYARWRGLVRLEPGNRARRCWRRAVSAEPDVAIAAGPDAVTTGFDSKLARAQSAEVAAEITSACD